MSLQGEVKPMKLRIRRKDGGTRDDMTAIAHLPAVRSGNANGQQEHYMTLNDWLKDNHMTQADLAHELNVTRETVNRAANGKPSGLFLWRFAKLAGFDAAKQLAESTKE